MVRSLAVDESGRIFVDTGPPGAGIVRKSDGLSVSLLRPGSVQRHRPGESLSDAAPSASRLATDGRGALFVALGAKLVAVDAEGTGLTTLAGDPSALPGAEGRSSAGDGGPVSAATFTSTRSIATDEAHNLFVADRVTHGRSTFRVRFINRSTRPVTFYTGTAQQLTVEPGDIATVAGGAEEGDGGGGDSDGGTALGSVLSGTPPSMAVVGARLYLGMYSPPSDGQPAVSSVRVINLGGTETAAHGLTVPAGGIAIVAGGGVAGFGGDGGNARAASFSQLPGIAADTNGNLYLADERHHRVRKVDSLGIISSVAGVGGISPDDGGFNGNGRLASEARLNRPHDVKVAQGQIYISDSGNHQVRVIDASGVLRAGRGNEPFWKCARSGDTPRKAKWQGLAVGRKGHLYFIDVLGKKLVKRSASDGSIDAVKASKGPMPPDDPGSQVLGGVAVRSDEALYLVDRGGTRISALNIGSRTITIHGVSIEPGSWRTVAGGTAGTDRTGSFGATAMAVDITTGSLLVGDSAGGRLLHIGPMGGVSTVAGNGAPPAARGCCSKPVALAVDPAGNVYVSDAATNRIWFVNRKDRPVTVNGQQVAPGRAGAVAGNGTTTGLRHEAEPATASPISASSGLALATDGNLYFSDTGDHSIRRVDKDGTLTTAVGNGQRGYNGDGLPAALSALDSPTNLALDQCHLVVLDSGNNRVRRVPLGPPCRETVLPPVRRDNRDSSGLAVAGVVLLAVSGGAISLYRRRHRHRHTEQP
ncbi:MAG TPA: SMP-30/gluconolactonase/LRE family protein [Acidimicrobiales bacterium]|nr:SMP-30/gluconolactonase/LRE family protein [Acidimicrobiales bacterium]